MTSHARFDPRVQLDPWDDTYYLAINTIGTAFYTRDYLSAVRWVND